MIKVKVFGLKNFVDKINTFAAAFITERWYQKILEEIAEEYKQDMLKKMKAL